jgi:uncharacterized membrane protein YedE/YeeE
MGGLGIGALMLMCYWVTGKPLGASRAYCAMLTPVSKLRFFAAAKADFNATRLWFLMGIPLGSAVALLTSPGAEWTITTSMGQYYDAMLPATPWAKTLVLFGGGLMMGVGARMAGGCTSGNVIVGVSHLSLPSIASGALFFIGGIVSVQMLYRVFA